jgi:hypothetical protein
MTTEQTLKADLIASKALIADPAHWTQTGPCVADGTYCAITACNDLQRAVDAFNALYDALPEAWRRERSTLGSVFEFNDHPDTTHADIMALFDRAIEAAS